MKIRDFLRLHPMFAVMVLFCLSVTATSFYLDKTAIAYFELAAGVILSLIVFYSEKKSYSDLQKTVEMINAHIVSRDDDRITGLPVPFVVCSPNGGIVWYNELFKNDVIGENELSDKQIKSFIPPDKLSPDAYKKSFNVSYNNKRFTVHVSKVNDDYEGDFILFFIDDTYHKVIADKYRDSRPVVMFVSVDAMDEVSSMISQNQYSTLLSDVEKMLMSWFTHYMCIIRKTGDGRFFVTAEYKVFTQMKKEDFDILDSVRGYRIDGVNAGFTVSVGIATGTELFACDSTARKALDMAKGRGGDQVVINENGEYEFFGGVASGVESRNQVQSRIVATSVEELIKHSSDVLIMGHKNSDLDAVGASIGLAEIVNHLGIPVKVIADEKTSMAKPLINYYKDVDSALFVSPQKAMSDLNDDTLVIIADVMRASFAESTEIAETAKKKVVIDHHRQSVGYIDDALIFYHEPNASSASEMVTELIRYMPSKPHISKEAAEGLLAGIYLDTKDFTLKAGVRTFEAAAYLKDRSADTITVRKLFSATADENALITSVVNSAKIKGNFAFATTESKDSQIRLACAKAADELLNIEDVDASFVIFNSGNNEVSVSARSYGRVNVQVIMEKLGGGGHQTMAAAQLKNTDVHSVLKLLEEAVSAVTKRNIK